MTPGGWRIAELSTLAYGDAVRSDGYNNNLGDPNLLADILGEIAGGSTLVLQAEAKGIPYKLLNRWIADDVERAKRYALALEIREQHAKDLIVAELVAYLKADVTEAFEGPNLKDLADMPPNLRRMVAGIKFNEVFTTIGSGKEKPASHRQHHRGQIHRQDQDDRAFHAQPCYACRSQRDHRHAVAG